MKFFLYLKIILFLSFLFSCKNRSHLKLDEELQTTQHLKETIFYIEFINNQNSLFCDNLIESIKKELFNNRYISLKHEYWKKEDPWQGIQKISKEEILNKKSISKYDTYLHSFKDFSEYKPDKSDPQKIIITINNSALSGIFNFNYRSYQKRGHKNWQSVFNPGNFRYTLTKNYDQEVLKEWMLQNILILNFK